MQDFACAAPEWLMDDLARRIEAETGLSYTGTKRRDLRNALPRMAEEGGHADENACAQWLLNGAWTPAKTALCARHLTIAETYFFREERAFELVRDHARATLAEGRQLRIWSAGCCTGEEPYSIAMRLLADMPWLPPHAVRILATDLNARNLRLAQDGVYRQWSFRNTRAALRSKYFSEAGPQQWRIADAVKRMVRFAELNLANPVYPCTINGTHAMDIIFCRNVLMYFSPGQAMRVIERFRDCLVEGGWLVVSPGEASVRLFEGYTRVAYPDAIYFQKPHRSAGERRTAPAAAPTVPAGSQADLRRGAGIRAPVPALRPETGTRDYQALAMAAIESGDRREAMQSLKRLAYLEPDSILAQYLMGVVLAGQGRRREAVRRFRAASELLAALDGEAVVPGTDGMRAAQLAESVRDHAERAGA